MSQSGHSERTIKHFVNGEHEQSVNGEHKTVNESANDGHGERTKKWGNRTFQGL